MFGACGVSLCILAANLFSERRLANILLFHGSAFHFVEFSRTVNRFGLTFPRLRIVGLLFKIHIPKTLLKILIQEIKMNYECFFFALRCCLRGLTSPTGEGAPARLQWELSPREVPESVFLLGTSGDSRIWQVWNILDSALIVFFSWS